MVFYYFEKILIKERNFLESLVLRVRKIKTNYDFYETLKLIRVLVITFNVFKLFNILRS